MTVDEPLHVYTGLRWHLDSNAVDDARIEPLVRSAELGWVRLSVGDQAHAEPMKNPEVYARLLPHLERFDVMFGVAILDHSRLDMSILASDEDAERFDLVFATLWPQRNREADGRGETREGRNRFRDAMHVDTAIRYGASGLVTQDEPMWVADARFREAFSGFRIVSIDEAISLKWSARSLGTFRLATENWNREPASHAARALVNECMMLSGDRQMRAALRVGEHIQREGRVRFHMQRPRLMRGRAERGQESSLKVPPKMSELPKVAGH